MREIEVKLKVENVKDLENRLSALGCKLSAPINQHDTVYSRAGSISEWVQAKEGDIILRIRRQDGEAIFTLKQQRSAEWDNIEYETKVESAEEMHNILTTLGYVPQVEVKKVRRKGKLGEYEICLDDVEKLGTYVELETLTGNDADPIAMEEELLKVLESLGLSRKDKEIRGYDTQIFQMKHKREND